MSDNLSILGKTYTGVTGLYFTDTNNHQQKYVNTSDANATAADILSPKTAYVNGKKITGTIEIATMTEVQTYFGLT